MQIYLHPNPLKTKQFLLSVPFISYRCVLSLIRALRPIDVYLGIHGPCDRLSGRYQQKASLNTCSFKVPAFCWPMHQTRKPIGVCDTERENKTYRSTLFNAKTNNSS